MDQAAPPQAGKASPARSAAVRPSVPRLYYVPLSMLEGPDRLGTVLDACAAMGFDTVLMSPPGDPGPSFNQLLPYDWSRPHPALPPAPSLAAAVAELSKLCRSRGLRLMVDLTAGQVAAGSPLAQALGLGGIGAGAQDPRIGPAGRNGLAIDFADAGLSRRYVEHLAALVTTLAEAGVAGFRCLHVDHVPAAIWTEITAAGRSVTPHCRFLAWTPGVPPEGVKALAQAGFDGTFSSLRWWDGRADWPVDERERLAALGPAIAFPEAPFDTRLAQTLDSDDIVQRRIERALWTAASLGDGILVPMGLEFGAGDPVPPLGNARRTYSSLRAQPRFDMGGTIKAVNTFLAGDGERFSKGDLRMLSGGGAQAAAFLRMDAADMRSARTARLVLVNPWLDRTASVAAEHLSAELGGVLPLRDAIGSSPNLDALSDVTLRPGEVRVLDGAPRPVIAVPAEMLRLNPKEAATAPRLVIEALSPTVDGGLYPAKRIVGDIVRVECDAFGEGHDPIAAALLWRTADEEGWHERRMTPLGNDRWAADLPLERVGRYLFTVEIWRDEFAIYHHELVKKHEAGLNLTLELEEGQRLVRQILSKAQGTAAARLKPLAESLDKADDSKRLAILLAPETGEILSDADPRAFRLRHEPAAIESERPGAGFASWYEIFPRSMSGDVSRHGTFDDVIGRLPAIRDMGFDVLYFPPIHPIGRTNRKGPNNSLTAGPDDPGSPYAIGAEAGGHDAIHPELGSFDDLRRLLAAAAANGLEIALDFAIQASPDHPWLKQHPEWFVWRPDGSIRYAENPPKKYEDIVNVDFYTEGAKPSLWVALRDAMKVWADLGIRLFRIDNPHTKPFPFWEWVIADIRKDYPDAVFLAEAFTRPKVMYRLAKVGFSQSYTYFTWRNTKAELQDYLTELTTEAPKEFFRPHFFVNTPDINPDFLQNAPRSAFLIRAALATTLSGLWGMYNGFELCEGRPDQKKKEYADSEKYQLVAWDWDRPGNIVAEITRLNRIRRDNPALHSHLGITFRNAGNDNILFFEKATPGRDNVLLVAVSLDPHAAQETDIEIPLWTFAQPDHGSIGVKDLMRGHRFTWTGKVQHIRLDPNELPFSIWRLGAARDL